LKLNRDILIQAVIKHQKVFFNLLDYIDKNDGALEVPEHLYLNDYNNIICQDDENDAQLYLSITSLVENGVFIHHNKGTGIITIERIIVDLLRFLDVKRARELTHSDFEFMRAQIVNTVEMVMYEPVDEQAFTDAMTTFNNLMSEIHSKVKENVHTLTLQVESIALDYKQYDSGSTETNVVNLYNKVSELYNRFVLPCYEFIDSNMDMIQTRSFSDSVQLLIEHFSSSQIDRFDLANKIQLRKTAITSYYKDISALATKLEQFSNHLEAERSTFLALESAYSQLMESIIPLRHGKKRNIYLTASSDIFSHHNVLDGLTNQKSKFGAKLRWDSEKTPIRLKEYLAVVKDKNIKSVTTDEIKPLPPTERPNQKKQILISRIVFGEKMPYQIPDIHDFIYRLLEQSLSDFKIADVLYGLEVFLPKHKHNTARSEVFSRNRLSDDRYFIEYVQLQYKKEVTHV
jgi:hypothetical protein